MSEKLKYPVLLVHGMGFRDGKYINYWGRIPAKLEENGCKVYYGNQDSNGTVEANGEFLAEKIREIIEETGATKLNVIAHSNVGGCKKSCVYGEIIFSDRNQICRNLLSNIITFMLSNSFSNISITR